MSDANQEPEAEAHPVKSPPHPFSEGEEVVTPDGTMGKVISIDATDPDNVRYEVVAPAKRFYSAAELQKD